MMAIVATGAIPTSPCISTSIQSTQAKIGEISLVPATTIGNDITNPMHHHWMTMTTSHWC